MGEMTEIVGLVDAGEFFAPASTDMIDGLVGQYRLGDHVADDLGVADGLAGQVMGQVAEGVHAEFDCCCHGLDNVANCPIIPECRRRTRR